MKVEIAKLKDESSVEEEKSNRTHEDKEKLAFLKKVDEI